MESGACSANLQSPRLLDARQVRSLSRSSPQLLAAPLPLAHTRSLPHCSSQTCQAFRVFPCCYSRARGSLLVHSFCRRLVVVLVALR